MKVFTALMMLALLYSCGTAREFEFDTPYYVKNEAMKIIFVNDSVCRVQERFGLAGYDTYGSYFSTHTNVIIDLTSVTEFEKVHLSIIDTAVNEITKLTFSDDVIFEIRVYSDGDEIAPYTKRPFLSKSLFIPNYTDSIIIVAGFNTSYTIPISNTVKGKHIHLVLPELTYNFFGHPDGHKVRMRHLTLTPKPRRTGTARFKTWFLLRWHYLFGVSS